MWDFLTAAEGPWWGEAAIAGLFLIVGALISLITSSIVEANKSKKDLARRFDEEIRESGASFINRCDDYWSSDRNYKRVVNLPGESDEKNSEIQAIHLEALENFRTARESVQPLSFVGPDSLIRSARNHLLFLIRSHSRDDLDSLEVEYQASRNEVVNQIRKTLKIPVSKIGKKAWYQKLNAHDIRAGIKAIKTSITPKFLVVYLIVTIPFLIVGIWLGLKLSNQ